MGQNFQIQAWRCTTRLPTNNVCYEVCQSVGDGQRSNGIGLDTSTSFDRYPASNSDFEMMPKWGHETHSPVFFFLKVHTTFEKGFRDLENFPYLDDCKNHNKEQVIRNQLLCTIR